MKTNFFENIAGLNVPGNWKIAIHADRTGQMTVSALFSTEANGDNAQKVVPPMVLTGTAQEMDEGFFEAIEQPVQQTAGLFRNMEAYLKSLEEAKKQSKMEQDKNKVKPAPGNVKSADVDIEVAESKVDKEAKLKAYDEAMRKVNELNDFCKYAEALDILPNETDYPDKKAELDKKRADLNRKKEQLEKLPQLF
ncbi:MAG: PRTRC system protein E [Mucilaginibacter sp.]|nr:PRTRC system protein E [Mucilaginibacter sp.]